MIKFSSSSRSENIGRVVDVVAAGCKNGVRFDLFVKVIVFLLAGALIGSCVHAFGGV